MAKIKKTKIVAYKVLVYTKKLKELIIQGILFLESLHDLNLNENFKCVTEMIKDYNNYVNEMIISIDNENILYSDNYYTQYFGELTLSLKVNDIKINDEIILSSLQNSIKGYVKTINDNKITIKFVYNKNTEIDLSNEINKVTINKLDITTFEINNIIQKSKKIIGFPDYNKFVDFNWNLILSTLDKEFKKTINYYSSKTNKLKYELKITPETKLNEVIYIFYELKMNLSIIIEQAKKLINIY